MTETPPGDENQQTETFPRTPPPYPGPTTHPTQNPTSQNPSYGWGQQYPPSPTNTGLGPERTWHIPPPEHPQAALSFVLGLVGLIGTVCCFFLLFLPPLAWYFGARALKEIDAQPTAFVGRDKAHTGMILGIVGTAVAGLMIVIYGIVWGLELLRVLE